MKSIGLFVLVSICCGCSMTARPMVFCGDGYVQAGVACGARPPASKWGAMKAHVERNRWSYGLLSLTGLALSVDKIEINFVGDD